MTNLQIECGVLTDDVWLTEPGESSVTNMIIYCSKTETPNLFFVRCHYSACITFAYLQGVRSMGLLEG